MSLINEALKRAEQDRRCKNPPPGQAPGLPPIPQPPRRKKLSRLSVTLFTSGLTVAAAVGALFIFSRHHAPRQAPAAAYDNRLLQNPTDHHVHAASPVRTVLAKTEKSLDYYEPQLAGRYRDLNPAQSPHPSGSQAAVLPPVTTHPASPVQTRSTDIAENPAAPSTQPARIARAATDTAARAATSKPSRAATGTPSTNPTTIQPPPARPAPLDASAYLLSGIMYGPSGPRAIINGKMVRLGQMIGDVKVVRIEAASVVLQRGSEKCRISL